MKIFLRLEKISTAGDVKEKLGQLMGRMERKLRGFREDFKKIWVKVRKERGVYRVKGRMKLPGKEVVVEEKGESLLRVVKEVRAGLVRQVEKYKKQ